MKVLFDTSVLVAGLVEGHPRHERAFPWLSRAKSQEVQLCVASHTLAELYAVLSSLPLKPRIPPGIAWRLIHENIEPVAKLVSLTPVEYGAVIKRLSERGLAGGIVYDALILKAAQKAKVEQVLTLNMKHFKKIWEGDASVLLEP